MQTGPRRSLRISGAATKTDGRSQLPFMKIPTGGPEGPVGWRCTNSGPVCWTKPSPVSVFVARPRALYIRRSLFSSELSVPATDRRARTPPRSTRSFTVSDPFISLLLFESLVVEPLVFEPRLLFELVGHDAELGPAAVFGRLGQCIGRIGAEEGQDAPRLVLIGVPPEDPAQVPGVGGHEPHHDLDLRQRPVATAASGLLDPVGQLGGPRRPLEVGRLLEEDVTQGVAVSHPVAHVLVPRHHPPRP